MDKEQAREIRKAQYQRMKESSRYKEMLQRQKDFRKKRYEEQKAWLRDVRFQEKQREREMEQQASRDSFVDLGKLVKPASSLEEA